MNKTLFVFALLAALAGKAHAIGDGLVENTEVYRSTFSCDVVSISSYSSSSVATELVGSTTAAIMHVIIQNMDGTASIYANEHPNVSTTTTAGVRGIKIPAIANGFDGLRKFVIVQGTKWYATCDATAAPCSVNRCLGR